MCRLAVIGLALASSMAIIMPVDAAQRPTAEEVIPAGALSVDGLWTAYKATNRVLFELPASALETDIVVQLKRSDTPVLSHQIIRWERQNDKIMLYSPETRLLNDSSGGLLPGQTVGETRLVEAFPILGHGRSGAPIIDVTALFTRDLAHWFKGEDLPSYRKSGFILDPAGTTIGSVKSFPQNVVVTAAQIGTEKGQAAGFQARWNFVLLPKQPMMPRLWDRRFGQYKMGMTHGGIDPRPGDDTLMLRWRLEKKQPAHKISDPVEPIVFYIDPKTPKKWRPYVQRGVEAWNSALEAAGFSNAVIAREAPADWSLDDVRYSTLLWNDAGAGRNEAPKVHDPRTGELLQDNLGVMPFYVQDLGAPRYFVANAALDPRAQTFPLPDEIIGALQTMVTSHEVGHLLGLSDGNYGKSAYSIENVRSPEWLARMGFTPSIMNYTRTNYVAQPEDSVPPALLLQHVGPADHYHIRAAYEPVPGARSATDEKPAMDALARRQESEPMYRFNFDYHEGVYKGVGSFPGPDTVLEVVETTDPIGATELGLKNLRVGLDLMRSATLHEGGGDANYAVLYEAARLHWMDMMHHVASMVGGYTRFRRAGYEPRPEGTPISAAEQRRAMRFLAKEAFQPPVYLIENGVTELLPVGPWVTGESEITRVMDGPANILEALFEPNKLRRLAEAEQGVGMFTGEADRYGLRAMLADVRAAIWSELESSSLRIDPYRQSLQQAYIELLKKRLTEQPGPSFAGRQARPLEAYIKNALASELDALRSLIERASAKVIDDPVVKAHLARAQRSVTVM